MSAAAAISYLEDRYETIAGALARARTGQPLGTADRIILREARLPADPANPMPPRPSSALWWIDSKPMRWEPGEKEGPDDWRPCP